MFFPLKSMEMDQMFLNCFLKYIMQLCMEHSTFSPGSLSSRIIFQIWTGVSDANNKNLHKPVEWVVG